MATFFFSTNESMYCTKFQTRFENPGRVLIVDTERAFGITTTLERSLDVFCGSMIDTVQNQSIRDNDLRKAVR